jgi:metabolite-proton symporter
MNDTLNETPMPDTSPGLPRRTLIEAVVASTIGTTIEWYDFFVYGLAAGLVFPRLFFPESDPFTGQLLSFGTYTIGFVARPLGGVVFGAMGDRVGRKSALVATLLLMGISTVLVGCMPVYDDIGVAAPLLLVSLRFAQGLGVGGEWGGAVLMALEHGHTGRRGFYASWPQAGVPLGMVSATGVVLLCQRWLGQPEFAAWGWRVPFLLSGLLIVLGLLMRLRLLETPLFAALQKEDQLSPTPIRETLRGHWREVLLAAGVRLAENACFYLFTVWIVSYGTHMLQMDLAVPVMAAAALELFTIPLFGLISDHWSRRGMCVAGCVLLMLIAFPYFLLLGTRDTVWIYIAIVVALAGPHAMLYSVQAALIPELFHTRVRCTGASLGYQLGAPFAGGLAPLIAATLVEYFPGQVWPLATYIILLASVSLLCVQRLAETSRRSLSG